MCFMIMLVDWLLGMKQIFYAGLKEMMFREEFLEI